VKADDKALLEKYISLWNLPDRARREQLTAVLTPDVYYADPNIVTHGAEQLDRYIGRTRQRFGGMEFTLAGPVEGHHGQIRFGWQCGTPGAEPVVAGLDVALLDGERIRAIHGFAG
jgi:hypothetical protein